MCIRDRVTEVSDRITTIEEQKMLRLVIISSNGNIFKNGNVKTLLSEMCIRDRLCHAFV